MSNSKQPVRFALRRRRRGALPRLRARRARRQGRPAQAAAQRLHGSISLVLLDSTDGCAHYGQSVTFNVSTTATTEPWVNLKCYQNGVLVAEGWNGYFDRSLTGRNFGLYSPSWTGGAADCTASLTTPQKAQLASTSFHVYG